MRWWFRAGSLAFAAVFVGAGVLSGLGSSLAVERRVDYPLTAPPQRLELAVDVGEVEIVTTDGPPSVTSLARYGFRSPQLSVREVDGVLRVESHCPAWWGNACEVGWRLALPADVAITATGGVGSFTVRGFTAPVSIDADVGDVTVEGSGADVSARLDVGDLSVETANPDARVSAINRTGAVTVLLPLNASFHVEADADVGSAQVEVARAETATWVIARTNVGDVLVRYR
ncbi:MAG: hypothetical protein WAW88_05690 [Nocardioides sp.]